MYVVWEEALLVQDRGQSLRARLDGHRLAVLVSVHLDNGVEAFFECVAVSSEANNGEDDAAIWIIGSDAEDFGDEAGVDIVAGGGASIAGEDCEV